MLDCDYYVHLNPARAKLLRAEAELRPRKETFWPICVEPRLLDLRECRLCGRPRPGQSWRELLRSQPRRNATLVVPGTSPNCRVSWHRSRRDNLLSRQWAAFRALDKRNREVALPHRLQFDAGAIVSHHNYCRMRGPRRIWLPPQLSSKQDVHEISGDVMNIVQNLLGTRSGRLWGLA